MSDPSPAIGVGADGVLSDCRGGAGSLRGSGHAQFAYVTPGCVAGANITLQKYETFSS